MPRSQLIPRQVFGERLRRCRQQMGVTQGWVAAEMTRRGHDVVAQSVSGWERGAFAPDRDKAEALDELLEAGGQLLDGLGYHRAGEAPLDERIDRWEAELAELRAELQGKIADVEERLAQLEGSAPAPWEDIDPDLDDPDESTIWSKTQWSESDRRRVIWDIRQSSARQQRRAAS